MERRLPKTEGMLVLDLRPWKSFDNVSTITDGPHEPLDNFEVSVIQSSFFFFFARRSLLLVIVMRAMFAELIFTFFYAFSVSS